MGDLFFTTQLHFNVAFNSTVPSPWGTLRKEGRKKKQGGKHICFCEWERLITCHGQKALQKGTNGVYRNKSGEARRWR